MGGSITKEQAEIIRVAQANTGRLSHRQKEVIQNISCRVSQFGQRCEFLTYREERILQQIEVKLTTQMAKHRYSKSSKPLRDKYLEECRQMLKD